MSFLVMLWWGNAKEELKREEEMDKHLQIAFSMTGLWSTILINPDTISRSCTLHFTEGENEALRSWANLSKCVQLAGSWSGIQTQVNSAPQPLHFLCPRLCPCDCLDGGHPALGTAGAEQAAQSLWPHAEFLRGVKRFTGCSLNHETDSGLCGVSQPEIKRSDVVSSAPGSKAHP